MNVENQDINYSENQKDSHVRYETQAARHPGIYYWPSCRTSIFSQVEKEIF